jgi:hypothetical protein
VSAEAPTTPINVGDTVTIEVRVSGDAPLGGLQLPPLQGDGFRIYDDQPTVESRFEPGTAGALASTAVFKRAVVPQTGGTLTLPPIRISYFNPDQGAYLWAETAPLPIVVNGAAPAASVASFAGSAPQDVASVGEDILPVRTDVAVGRPIPGAWGALFALPGLAWLASQGLGTVRPRARARARRFDFADLPTDPEGRLAGLERIFRERVGARLGVAPDALHREDLARLGAGADAAERVYGALERLRYGGARESLPEAELRALVEGL